MPERLSVETTDQVAHVRLNKPDEYNRMPPAFWREFPETLLDLDATGNTRAVVISSTGKHFSAGLDISAFGGGGRSAPNDPGRAAIAARDHLAAMQHAFRVLDEVRMPVLVATQGGCVGGGVDLVAACDARYCTADAFFCIQEINIGLAADVGTLQRLPRLIPDGLMRELAYTGRRLPAEEARDAGLVNRVFDDPETMVAHVLDLAHEIARKSPVAVYSTKHLLNYSRHHSIDESLAYQQIWMGAVQQGSEIATHFAAKQNGDEPVFADLPPRRDAV